MQHDVSILIDNVELKGILCVPKTAKGFVIFVHGSGSSRLSARNQFVAEGLNSQNLGTLLFDLLTSEEEQIDNVTRELRFNIGFLAKRLVKVTQWCRTQSQLKTLTYGYFGASTGAAAAIVAAAALKQDISAIVSRGGRPDLAKVALSEIVAPTLLIVGGYDDVVIELNQQAFSQITCTHQLEIIPGATHLFEEPGTLEEAAKLATNWFIHYLT